MTRLQQVAALAHRALQRVQLEPAGVRVQAVLRHDVQLWRVDFKVVPVVLLRHDEVLQLEVPLLIGRVFL